MCVVGLRSFVDVLLLEGARRDKWCIAEQVIGLWGGQSVLSEKKCVCNMSVCSKTNVTVRQAEVVIILHYCPCQLYMCK